MTSRAAERLDGLDVPGDFEMVLASAARHPTVGGKGFAGLVNKGLRERLVTK
ncbi:hypothetical protein [Candidatus Amarobacter glycogenicus]|uniref:hypothetical protein n=1 Tax=Candidatus Amarobacter glycogenicus TaxID=3140699 RepID=UPI0031352197|nr:hypothetical protein [Dehalococcoidia bacterium]